MFKAGEKAPLAFEEVVKIMNVFTIKGTQGYIRMELQNASGFPHETSHFGGYDAKGIVEIKSGNYHVLGEIWFTTEEWLRFALGQHVLQDQR